MARIVGIGGGTGLSVLLRGLRDQAARFDAGLASRCLSISAIVAVSDTGGSSGRLRRSLNIPAVGDLRNCLVALSNSSSPLPELFRYRFPAGDGLQGHSLGNLIVSALCLMSGSLGQATELAGELLEARGCVMPCTELSPTLCAELGSGALVHGEAQITAARQNIRHLWLEPRNPPAAPGVLEHLEQADLIVFGPGSLYTSIVPNLLVAGVAEAVQCSPARKIFVCNLMTEPGESAGLSASGHLSVMERYLGPDAVDCCVLNTAPIPVLLRDKYSESGAEPVAADQDGLARGSASIVARDLLDESGMYIRHDPAKLAETILELHCGAETGSCHAALQIPELFAVQEEMEWEER